MIGPRAFPPHLLHASNADRLVYFNEFMAMHPMLENAMQDMNDMASGLLDQRLVLLLGAAGVGKSELMKIFIRNRILHCTVQMDSDPQRVPGLFVELESPVKGSFNFVPFYKEALATLSCVLPGRTLASIDRLAGKTLVRSVHAEAAGRKPSAEDLKTRFAETLCDRMVEICGLDEAVNAFKTASSLTESRRDDAITDQANIIKSMVNKSQTTFVLVGAFDFYQLTVGTAQLARRSQIVHLKPYSATEQDLQGFLTAFTTLLAHLPIDHEIEPSKHATEMFLQSLGCIGNLKNILKTALNKALNRSKKLSIELVRQSYFSAPALLKMKSEQETGIAGLNNFMNSDDLAGRFDESPSSVTRSTRVVSGRGKRLKPGETKPSHRVDAAAQWGKNEV